VNQYDSVMRAAEIVASLSTKLEGKSLVTARSRTTQSPEGPEAFNPAEIGFGNASCPLRLGTLNKYASFLVPLELE
jgi:hypothetical protein